MNYKFLILYIFSNILYSNNLVAQTSAAFIEAGDAAMSRNDFAAALQFYSEAAEGSANNNQLIWKTAEAARQSNAFGLAEQLYSKLTDANLQKKYPMAAFWKAAMNRNMGKYKDAKEGYLSFLDQNGISEDEKLLAKAEIKTCNWAISVVNAPKDVTIEHLGKYVNSPYSEFGAVKKNDTLFFSSLRFENKKDDRVPPRLITKILETNDTSTARPMSGFNDDNLHTASLAISQKQNKVIFCLCQYVDKSEQIRCDLYSRKKEGNGWSKPLKLPEHINIPSTSTTQPALGTDEKGNEILYFASDRKEGKGKYDIWYSFLLANDQYSAPVNLAAINTKGDEMTPFYYGKNKTLYFSSDGYETLGGLDIYRSQKSGGVFSSPQHMGAPLNSSYNDFYFNILPEGKEAYFSSNRIGSQFLDKKNETCCYDIYKVNFPDEFLKSVAKNTSSASKSAVSAEKNRNNVIKNDVNVNAKSNIKNGNQKISEVTAANSTVIPTNDAAKTSEGLHKDSSFLKQNGIKINGADLSPEFAEKAKSYRKSALDAFLPLPLYFDNDEPDHNTKSPTTKKTYQEAFETYYARKLEYMEKSGKGMQPLRKIQTETDMMLFFEQTIKPNFEKLKEFTPILLYRLDKGDQYEIILKGYASPLAKNDYNNFLGQRRVRSLYNYWNTYQNNAFEKYFKNGQLKLTLVSFGEETAAKNISDDEHNEAGSIYNVRAAKERRIEIIEVKGDEK